MKKRIFLKVMEILSVFTILFFMAGYSAAQGNNAWIEFGDIDQSAEDAQYIQWEIKASKFYGVTIYFEDDDGDDFEVTFNTEDGDDKAYSDYFVVKIGNNYYDYAAIQHDVQFDHPIKGIDHYLELGIRDTDIEGLYVCHVSQVL